jgi:hypothetical protein
MVVVILAQTDSLYDANEVLIHLQTVLYCCKYQTDRQKF